MIIDEHLTNVYLFSSILLGQSSGNIRLPFQWDEANHMSESPEITHTAHTLKQQTATNT
jgi:hypothetical protein